jgi:hypothetical protein
MGNSWCASADPQPAPAPPPEWRSFWTWHVLSTYFTGVANKNTANELCEVGFIAYFCFGQDTAYSAYNTEEHVDNTVVEFIQVWVHDGFDQYLSCCPPYSKAGGTNTGDFYRCNSWTGEGNDNCHTPNLPWNDDPPAGTQVVTKVGAINPPGETDQWMYSYPAQGEGFTWKQGLARRIYSPELANAWRTAAGGCNQCGAELEDGCVGQCLKSALSADQLKSVFDDVAGDLNTYPNYGVPGSTGILLANQPSYCIDLAGGDSSWKTALQVWPCNGLVNQAFEWISYQLILAGSNNPGKCIDLPGGDVRNENPLWLWGVRLLGSAFMVEPDARP